MFDQGVLNGSIADHLRQQLTKDFGLAIAVVKGLENQFFLRGRDKDVEELHSLLVTGKQMGFHY